MHGSSSVRCIGCREEEATRLVAPVSCFLLFESKLLTSDQVPLISISVVDCAARALVPRVDDRRGALLMSEPRRAAMLPTELLPVTLRWGGG